MARESVNPNLAIVAVLAVVGVVLLYKAKQAATSAVQAVNPLNNNNIFATGVNDVGAAVSGDPYWTLGGAVYDQTHNSGGGLKLPDVLNPMSPSDPVYYINPLASGNIVNAGVTSAGQAISGDPGWTLGGWIYDLTHPAGG